LVSVVVSCIIDRNIPAVTIMKHNYLYFVDFLYSNPDKFKYIELLYFVVRAT